MDNMGAKGCSFARSLSPIVPHAAYRFGETAVTVRPAHAPHDNPVVAESFGHVGTPPLVAGVGGFFTIRRQR